ncbi:MAG: hypothetical protein K6U78_01880 [Anaerolineae bacterium]|nr:hypothetical protein [Anaerolineae bacterium]
MINADIFFVFYLIVWGFIGTSRGWVREVIVTFTMLFALFIYSLPQFNNVMNPLWTQSEPIWRFFWRAMPFLVIAFFGYLSPVVARGRFQVNAANRFEYSLLSFMIGVFNGYLLFSSLAFWALQAGLLDGQYANLFTPPPGGWNKFFFIESAAPVIFSGSLLIFVLIVIFLFVIVVLV